MSNLLYLGIAVAVSSIGILVLWYRNRKPRSLESGIEEFQRELRALAPDRSRSGQSQNQNPIQSQSTTEQKDRRSTG